MAKKSSRRTVIDELEKAAGNLDWFRRHVLRCAEVAEGNGNESFTKALLALDNLAEDLQTLTEQLRKAL